MPPKQYENPPGLIIEATKRYHAVVKTDKGDMTIDASVGGSRRSRSTTSSFWPATAFTKTTSSTGSSTGL